VFAEATLPEPNAHAHAVANVPMGKAMRTADSESQETLRCINGKTTSTGRRNSRPTSSQVSGSWSSRERDRWATPNESPASHGLGGVFIDAEALSVERTVPESIPVEFL